MIFAVEWKCSFCALKSFNNRLYKGTLKYSIFIRNLCGQPILIFFSQVGLVRCVVNSVLFILLHAWILVLDAI